MKPPSAKLLSLALRRCRDAEIVWEERVDLDLANPQIPRRLSGWGVRVNYEGGLGFSWGDLSETPEALLEQAVAEGRENPGTGVLFSHGLPFTGPSHPVDEVDLQPGLAELQRLVERIQFQLPSLLPGWTTRIRGGIRFQRMTLVTRAGEQTAHRTQYLLAVHADSPAAIHASLIARRLPYSPAEILCELAWRASHSKPPKKGFEVVKGERPAVLSASATAALVRDLVSEHLDASQLVAPPALGQAWLSEKLTLTEDGTLSDGPGSTPFDGEGQARRPVPLVQAGTLAQVLVDRFHARRLGLKPEPLAVRDWGSSPRPGYSNLVLAPGESSLPELVKANPEGILLDHLVPCDAEREPGEFCRIAQIAYRIKQGRPAERIAPVVVRGHFEQLLGEGLGQLSRERSWHGRCLTPALSVGEVMLEPIGEAQEGAEEAGTWW